MENLFLDCQRHLFCPTPDVRVQSEVFPFLCFPFLPPSLKSPFLPLADISLGFGVCVSVHTCVCFRVRHSSVRPRSSVLSHTFSLKPEPCRGGGGRGGRLARYLKIILKNAQKLHRSVKTFAKAYRPQVHTYEHAHKIEQEPPVSMSSC